MDPPSGSVAVGNATASCSAARPGPDATSPPLVPTGARASSPAPPQSGWGRVLVGVTPFKRGTSRTRGLGASRAVSAAVGLASKGLLLHRSLGVKVDTTPGVGQPSISTAGATERQSRIAKPCESSQGVATSPAAGVPSSIRTRSLPPLLTAAAALRPVGTTKPC